MGLLRLKSAECFSKNRNSFWSAPGAHVKIKLGFFFFQIIFKTAPHSSGYNKTPVNFKLWTKSRRLWSLTWVRVTRSGQVPEVVNEIQAVVVLHLSLGAQVGEQLQRLSTNLILSFCRHCPPASFWLVGHSGWSSTSSVTHTHARAGALSRSLYQRKDAREAPRLHPWMGPVRSTHSRNPVESDFTRL